MVDGVPNLELARPVVTNDSISIDGCDLESLLDVLPEHDPIATDTDHKHLFEAAPAINVIPPEWNEPDSFKEFSFGLRARAQILFEDGRHFRFARRSPGHFLLQAIVSLTNGVPGRERGGMEASVADHVWSLEDIAALAS